MNMEKCTQKLNDMGYEGLAEALYYLYEKSSELDKRTILGITKLAVKNIDKYEEEHRILYGFLDAHITGVITRV